MSRDDRVMLMLIAAPFYLPVVVLGGVFAAIWVEPRCGSVAAGLACFGLWFGALGAGLTFIKRGHTYGD